MLKEDNMNFDFHFDPSNSNVSKLDQRYGW